jgi:molybdopterin-containing oxidoreductase family membrane subunit
MSTPAAQREEWTVLAGSQSSASVTDRISGIVLRPRAGRGWRLGLALAFAFTLMFVASVVAVVAIGVGIWGIDIPVAWGFAIIDYVWWIGIGMAGTFISAALYLLRQEWRTSLNRYAEAMTVFAVAVSGFFPILHLGRPWFFYWLFPYPDVMNVWPQWRSSLEWDFFAILAYLIVSILFWYVGMLPDLASVRDRARSRGAQVFYGLLALGWRGEARHWQRHEALTAVLAGLAVPLVFSVHSMVALDFSEGVLAGWHTTIFPPFFVAGALFSGFGMALVLGIPMRARLGLSDFITPLHLDHLGKALLAIGLIVDYGYAVEIFTSFYSMDPYEVMRTRVRMHGPYAWSFWSTIVCNVVVIQALWWRRVRRSTTALFTIGLVVVVGMWLERFMLVVTTLYRTYLPARSGGYAPTTWDLAMLAGSVGLFALMFLLFVRLLPVIPMFETRRFVHERAERPP